VELVVLIVYPVDVVAEFISDALNLAPDIVLEPLLAVLNFIEGVRLPLNFLHHEFKFLEPPS